MRHSTFLVATLAIAACATAPIPRGESRDASTTQVTSSGSQKTAPDILVQELLSYAASDFHAHRPTDPGRFRDVHVGHLMTPGGDPQYMLCGDFLSSPDEGEAQWTPFATIKTSGYEQWLGSQAASICKRPSIAWNNDGDLSSLLQSRLNSLR